MENNLENKYVQTLYGRFPMYYKQARLGDICVKPKGVQTGPFGSQLHKRDYVETGTPILTVEHLGDNRIIRENLPKVSSVVTGKLCYIVL